ncbi:MAG TPA: TonB-dependent receptor plug domain-containing protein, partial [Bacteroidales bacterium]|nr:TonB-dependent receptor plug domain-containing protein [Bacteroidales bacterium]
MKKRFSATFLISMLTGFVVLCQTPAVIKGKVVESGTGEELIGVIVAEVNSQNRTINGTITDNGGNFALKLSSPENKIKVSYIGYKTIEFPWSGQSYLEIKLEEESLMFEEVVITGESKKVGGLTPVTERDRTSAISTIDMKELKEVHASTVGEMLMGRASNVDISMASGDPGAGMSIKIRGTASISGSNQPLIVVDGVPFEIELDKDFDFSAVTQEQFSGMLNVAPEDILSIQVLKDASATAVWGSRGANGVLLIDTKRG